jgi:hypothetical protein
MRVRFPFRALLILSLGLSACGDDEPTAPDDHVIEFPGDAATLQDAIDLAAAGDTVRVAAGTHAVDTPVVVPAEKSGITIEGDHSSSLRHGERPILDFHLGSGEDGITVRAQNVKIHEIEIRGTLRDGVLFDSSPGTNASGGTIEGCVIAGDLLIAGDLRDGISCIGNFSDTHIERNIIVSAQRFGVSCWSGSDPLIERNTIVGTGDCAIYSNAASPICRRNAIAHTGNWGIACFVNPIPELSCNVLWQSANGHYSPECVPGANDIDADPRFCEETSYTLMPDSPCLPQNNEGCGNIGAVATSCGS